MTRAGRGGARRPRGARRGGRRPGGRGARGRHPIVLTLVALAVVTALTAAWTIGAPSDAARDAAAVLALCALVVAAACLPAPWGHAGILLFAALATAVAGLAATIATSEPLALNLCGSWRPAGPFEYPPALALVCASALPVALCAATERRHALAIPGALAAWLLVMTVALTANRHGRRVERPRGDRVRGAGAACPRRGAGRARGDRRGHRERPDPARRPRARRRRRPRPGAAAGLDRRGRGAVERRRAAGRVAARAMDGRRGCRGHPGHDRRRPGRPRIALRRRSEPRARRHLARGAAHGGQTVRSRATAPAPSWRPPPSASSRSAPSRRASPTISGCRSGSS